MVAHRKADIRAEAESGQLRKLPQQIARPFASQIELVQIHPVQISCTNVPNFQTILKLQGYLKRGQSLESD